MSRPDSVAGLRWGLLGTAGIARNSFVPGLRALSAGRAEAVASRDGARARAFADDLGVPLSFGSYAEMLASGAVDAVYNALPNALHAEWTIRALEAGLPVLCEKPLGLHASEGRAIADASRRTGLPVAEAFMYRFHPVHDAVLAALAAGAIGRPSTIRSTFTFVLDDESAIPASVPLGGGALRDVGCYCVDFSRRVAGAEPLRATAFERRAGVDRTFLGLLEFPGGLLAQFECSIENRERHEAEVHGTAGSLVLDCPWLPPAEAATYGVRRDGGEEAFAVPGDDCYGLEALDFARAVVDGTPPRFPLRDSLANLAAIDALLESARTGRTVRVAPP